MSAVSFLESFFLPVGTLSIFSTNLLFREIKNGLISSQFYGRGERKPSFMDVKMQKDINFETALYAKNVQVSREDKVP